MTLEEMECKYPLGTEVILSINSQPSLSGHMGIITDYRYQNGICLLGIDIPGFAEGHHLRFAGSKYNIKLPQPSGWWITETNILPDSEPTEEQTNHLYLTIQKLLSL